VRVERLQYDGFDYDLGNVRKIQSHGLSLGEIEDFFAQDLLILEDTRHSNQKERRLIAVGRSRKRRPMFVAFTLRTKGGETYIRPISARYCHKKEAELYENLKKNISKDE
jgi:uncharacterized DUF497 family protein